MAIPLQLAPIFFTLSMNEISEMNNRSETKTETPLSFRRSCAQYALLSKGSAHTDHNDELMEVRNEQICYCEAVRSHPA